MSNIALKDCKYGEKVQLRLMVKKIIDRKENMIWAYAGDNYKDIKCIFGADFIIGEGEVLLLKGHYMDPFKPDKIEKIEDYNIKEFLPSSKRPIEDIMKEIEELTMEEITSEEGRALNDYFFKDEDFLGKFKKAIGGVLENHNYLGGLAQHTLDVMYLAKTLAYRYDIKYKELAVLGAKLHDIGKVNEMKYDGPFAYTNEGWLHGHIIIGAIMVEKAFEDIALEFSDDFKDRIKAIIVQQNGDLDFSSPVPPRMVESWVVHNADYVDTTMNKVHIDGEVGRSGELDSSI